MIVLLFSEYNKLARLWFIQWYNKWFILIVPYIDHIYIYIYILHSITF